MSITALLLLADSRLPIGGHVHSGGIEEAIAQGLIGDDRTLAAFLHRRARYALVPAAISACACVTDDLPALDREADARMASPAQRNASRAQGRGLLRVGSSCWPDARWALLPATPHLALAVGVAACASGLTAHEAALVSAYLTVSGPASAAQRLLGLDPDATAATLASLGPALDRVALVSSSYAEDLRDLSALPCDGDPLADLLAESHASREERLFVS